MAASARQPAAGSASTASTSALVFVFKWLPLRSSPPMPTPKQRLHLLISASPPALQATFEGADAVHLVPDLCAGGDLFSLVSARALLSEPEAANLLAQLVDALVGTSSPTPTSSTSVAGGEI